MTKHLSDSRLANLGAEVIRNFFAQYALEFRRITARAPQRFAAAQWRGLVDDSVERLELYSRVVNEAVAQIRDLLTDRVEDKLVWASMKAVYSGTISDRSDQELAETFFNSVSRKIFTTVGLDPQIEFVATDIDLPKEEAEQLCHTYPKAGSLPQTFVQILSGYDLGLPFEDIDTDAQRLAQRVEATLTRDFAIPVVSNIEMLRSVFYRGERAFLIGKLFTWLQRIPLVIALENTRGMLRVDAVLLEENDVSILFSFTRSYFMVDVPRPCDLVRFLGSLMPRKRVAEIYNSIGYNKHGKTEQYRDLLHHLAVTNERFEFAQGTRGLVMIAFTLPGYDVIFKVIRDRFPPEKSTCREDIMAKYHFVYTRDRAGRLVEAQEFEFLKFHRQRFDESLLEELQNEAAENIRFEGDMVILRHAYLERRVIPLNLYIRDAKTDAMRAAVIDLGRSIRELAWNDIFPGDLLVKNFGVTRHGRVVFYDYDEISDLNQCIFRKKPEPRTEEQVMAAEPWYRVGPYDIFPEEFRAFLGLSGHAREVFEAHHGDLFEHETWTAIQARVRAGVMVHAPQYADDRKL